MLGRAAAAAVMGMSLLGGLRIWAPPAAGAAENLVFVSGAFRRSIPVADLEKLAATGQAQGLLADVLRFSNQNPKTVAQLLNQSVKLPVTPAIVKLDTDSVLSTSESLVSTLPVAGVSSLTVLVSATVTVGSFTAVTLIVSVEVAPVLVV